MNHWGAMVRKWWKMTLFELLFRHFTLLDHQDDTFSCSEVDENCKLYRQLHFGWRQEKIHSDVFKISHYDGMHYYADKPSQISTYIGGHQSCSLVPRSSSVRCVSVVHVIVRECKWFLANFSWYDSILCDESFTRLSRISI